MSKTTWISNFKYIPSIPNKVLKSWLKMGVKSLLAWRKDIEMLIKMNIFHCTWFMGFEDLQNFHQMDGQTNWLADKPRFIFCRLQQKNVKLIKKSWIEVCRRSKKTDVGVMSLWCKPNARFSLKFYNLMSSWSLVYRWNKYCSHRITVPIYLILRISSF